MARVHEWLRCEIMLIKYLESALIEAVGRGTDPLMIAHALLALTSVSAPHCDKLDLAHLWGTNGS